MFSAASLSGFLVRWCGGCKSNGKNAVGKISCWEGSKYTADGLGINYYSPHRRTLFCDVMEPAFELVHVHSMMGNSIRYSK